MAAGSREASLIMRLVEAGALSLQRNDLLEHAIKRNRDYAAAAGEIVFRASSTRQKEK